MKIVNNSTKMVCDCSAFKGRKKRIDWNLELNAEDTQLLSRLQDHLDTLCIVKKRRVGRGKYEYHCVNKGLYTNITKHSSIAKLDKGTCLKCGSHKWMIVPHPKRPSSEEIGCNTIQEDANRLYSNSQVLYDEANCPIRVTIPNPTHDSPVWDDDTLLAVDDDNDSLLFNVDDDIPY